MRKTFKQYLIEKEEEKRKPVFKETDGRSPFPENTIVAIEKEITALSKDLDTDWRSASHVTDAAMENLKVPKPPSYAAERWKQYIQLLSHAVKQLYKSRGFKSSWNTTVQ